MRACPQSLEPYIIWDGLAPGAQWLRVTHRQRAPYLCQICHHPNNHSCDHSWLFNLIKFEIFYSRTWGFNFVYCFSEKHQTWLFMSSHFIVGLSTNSTILIVSFFIDWTLGFYIYVAFNFSKHFGQKTCPFNSKQQHCFKL